MEQKKIVLFKILFWDLHKIVLETYNNLIFPQSALRFYFVVDKCDFGNYICRKYYEPGSFL